MEDVRVYSQGTEDSVGLLTDVLTHAVFRGC